MKIGINLELPEKVSNIIYKILCFFRGHKTWFSGVEKVEGYEQDIEDRCFYCGKRFVWKCIDGKYVKREE